MRELVAVQDCEIFRTLLDVLSTASLFMNRDRKVILGKAASVSMSGDEVSGRLYINVLRHPLVLQPIKATIDGQPEVQI